MPKKKQKSRVIDDKPKINPKQQNWERTPKRNKQ